MPKIYVLAYSLLPITFSTHLDTLLVVLLWLSAVYALGPSGRASNSQNKSSNIHASKKPTLYGNVKLIKVPTPACRWYFCNKAKIIIM